jgi:FKBP-type peptidyl-prolyl cis-trans isomerase FkpA
VLKQSSRWLIVGLVVSALVGLAGCSSTPQASNPQTSTSAPTTSGEPAAAPGKVPDVTELKIEDMVVGTGAEAASGKAVSVHYTGWLANGTEFDSSVDRGTPLQFWLGQGDVIRGWDEGLVGMKVGGKRRLTIPPELGYGAKGSGGVIPANATLVYDVELMSVK